jgi:hypothetical protein
VKTLEVLRVGVGSRAVHNVRPSYPCFMGARAARAPYLLTDLNEPETRLAFCCILVPRSAGAGSAERLCGLRVAEL